MSKLESAISGMTAELRRILCEPTVYLYGSATLNDFHEGWSDIDILVLSEDELTESQAETLLWLRQELTSKDHLFRAFEGEILPKTAFLNGNHSKAVYWGTSGQRITDGYSLDVFSRYLLKKHGVMLCGKDIRAQIPMPDYEELCGGVRNHFESIRMYAQSTGDSLYSCGWLLDISRGLYTVETGDVISKTAAANWALERSLCPDPIELMHTLAIRQEPLKYKNSPETKAWLLGLLPAIQRYADVLEDMLSKRSKA